MSGWGWGDFFGTFLRAAEDANPAAADAAAPAAGRLTLAQFEQWLDELWDAGRSPSVREVCDYGARAVMPPDPFCGAVLFAPDDGLRQAIRLEVIEFRGAVDPWTAEYLNSPVQGPAPLRCELEPHPGGAWHRDGRTWFR